MVEFAEKKAGEQDKKLSFILTTNGIALSSEKLDFSWLRRSENRNGVIRIRIYNVKNPPFLKVGRRPKFF